MKKTEILKMLLKVAVEDHRDDLKGIVHLVYG